LGVGSIYGIDILEDNVKACRLRLQAQLVATYRQLFPQTFRICRTNYALRTQASTRADFDDWSFLTGTMRAPVQIQMPPYRNEFVTTPPRQTNSTNYNTTYTVPQTTHFSPSPSSSLGSRTVRTWGGEDTLGLLSLALSVPNENWLASFFDSVPVRPTSAEIERGSELLQNTAIADDVICTICQEHEQSPNTGTWRKLLRCQHIFHQTCVDRWFTRNSHCPVCRADVRERTVAHPPTMPNSTESDDSPM
jgi:hypothetical protein